MTIEEHYMREYGQSPDSFLMQQIRKGRTKMEAGRELQEQIDEIWQELLDRHRRANGIKEEETVAKCFLEEYGQKIDTYHARNLAEGMTEKEASRELQEKLDAVVRGMLARGMRI